MITIIAGIILVILAAALWLGGISLVHAVALLLLVLGVVLILVGVVPSGYYTRRGPRTPAV